MTMRFVLSGYYGFENFGDEAILSVLVKRLQQDKHHLTIISSNPQYTKQKFKHIRCVHTFDIRNIIGFISKSDCLISGGGSLLQDVTSIKSLIYYLFIIFIALACRKKVIIFAQGIGPIHSKFGQILTKDILKHCNYISVRDAKSRDLLANWGINSDLVCDPVFSSKVETTENDGSVAIQLRDFKTMTEDFIDRLALRVSHEFSGRDINIYPFQPSIDLEICKKFEKALKMLDFKSEISLYENLTDEDIVANIAKSEYLIAMRFHAVIIGILAKVKTLGINYDTKVEKLCREYGLPLIELDRDFENEFEQLKNLDMGEITIKEFDWSGFNKEIERV